MVWLWKLCFPSVPSACCRTKTCTIIMKPCRRSPPAKCSGRKNSASGVSSQAAWQRDSRWGHPWPDGDFMPMFGVELGVNIPKDKFPSKCQSPECSSPALTSQGCRGNSCLEYLPEDSPPAYTKLLITDIPGLMKWGPARNVNVDLSDCVEERDGYSWLNTARLNQAIMQVFNEDGVILEQVTDISGPAGQVT